MDIWEIGEVYLWQFGWMVKEVEVIKQGNSDAFLEFGFTDGGYVPFAMPFDVCC